MLLTTVAVTAGGCVSAGGSWPQASLYAVIAGLFALLVLLLVERFKY